jgi:hypothetical protein
MRTIAPTIAHRTVEVTTDERDWSTGRRQRVVVMIVAVDHGGPYVDLYWHHGTRETFRADAATPFEVVNVWDYRTGTRENVTARAALAGWLNSIRASSRGELSNYYRHTA